MLGNYTKNNPNKYLHLKFSCVLFADKCDGSSTYICLDDTAITHRRITDIKASSSFDDSHGPFNAFQSSQSYQAAPSENYVHYNVYINPNLFLKITDFKFNTKNADNIMVTLEQGGVINLLNSVCTYMSELCYMFCYVFHLQITISFISLILPFLGVTSIFSHKAKREYLIESLKLLNFKYILQ